MVGDDLAEFADTVPACGDIVQHDKPFTGPDDPGRHFGADLYGLPIGGSEDNSQPHLVADKVRDALRQAASLRRRGHDHHEAGPLHRWAYSVSYVARN